MAATNKAPRPTQEEPVVVSSGFGGQRPHFPSWIAERYDEQVKSHGKWHELELGQSVFPGQQAASAFASNEPTPAAAPEANTSLQDEHEAEAFTTSIAKPIDAVCNWNSASAVEQPGHPAYQALLPIL